MAGAAATGNISILAALVLDADVVRGVGLAPACKKERVAAIP